MENMEKKREEIILKICDAVKGQSERDAIETKTVMSGLRLAYDSGFMNGAAASA